ncbi:MAG: hypothetical protein SGARI_007053 [Bacillariaceae sp.]
MVNTLQEMVDPTDRTYSELVRYAEGVCRAVGIKYGMAHVEIKAEFDETRKKWINPAQKCVQSFIPSDKNGVLKSLKGDDFDRLSTYHDSIMLKNIGDTVRRAKDIMSFAAYVWLIGDDEEAVMRDATLAREEFIVEVAGDPVN